MTMNRRWLIVHHVLQTRDASCAMSNGRVCFQLSWTSRARHHHHSALAAHPDATSKLQVWLNARSGQLGCLWNRLSFSIASLRASEQDRPVAVGPRSVACAQPELKSDASVFIDETGAATDMARRYGRCPRGERLVCSVPWGHWKTTTFVAALRLIEPRASIRLPARVASQRYSSVRCRYGNAVS